VESGERAARGVVAVDDGIDNAWCRSTHSTRQLALDSVR
jgi:hypothetical protein